jgi:hypothetical protein
VRATIHVEYLSGYLICLCQEKDSAANVFYLHDLPQWLPCLRRTLGIVLMQGCIHNARAHGVEADTFFCILDCETPDHCVQASPS